MNFNFYHDVPGKFKKKTILQHKAVPEKTKFSTDPFVFTSIKKLQCTLLLAVASVGGKSQYRLNLRSSS